MLNNLRTDCGYWRRLPALSCVLIFIAILLTHVLERCRNHKAMSVPAELMKVFEKRGPRPRDFVSKSEVEEQSRRAQDFNARAYRRDDYPIG